MTEAQIFTIELLEKNTLMILKKSNLSDSQKLTIKNWIQHIKLDLRKFESKVRNFDEILKDVCFSECVNSHLSKKIKKD